MEKEKKAKNRYVGMNLDELKNQLSINNLLERNAKRRLKTLKENFEREVEEQMHIIEMCEMNKRQIQYAKTRTDKVDFEIVMFIHKEVKSEWVGTNKNKSWYDANDWKDVTYYTYNILRCNKVDNSKSVQTLRTNKTKYTIKDKQAFTEAVIADIKDFEVTRVCIRNDTKVNTTAIKSVCSNIEIV